MDVVGFISFPSPSCSCMKSAVHPSCPMRCRRTSTYLASCLAGVTCTAAQGRKSLRWGANVGEVSKRAGPPARKSFFSPIRRHACRGHSRIYEIPIFCKTLPRVCNGLGGPRAIKPSVFSTRQIGRPVAPSPGQLIVSDSVCFADQEGVLQESHSALFRVSSAPLPDSC